MASDTPAHRLAVLHVTGAWPQHEITHADSDYANNRFANLLDIPRTARRQRHRAANPPAPLTAERLREELDYDPLTGIFTRRISFRMAVIGDVAGTATNGGYLKMSVCGEEYLAHRLAFLWMTNDWPKYHVDHIDHDRSNNRWVNLRDVPLAINNQNTPKTGKGNKLGLAGVVQAYGGRFAAYIKRYRNEKENTSWLL